MGKPFLLRARAVVPMSSDPIDDGAVIIFNGGVAAAGPYKDLAHAIPKEDRRDLGDVILMPGLVNAHCHLDYTALAGLILPTRDFPGWVKTISSFKAGWDFSEYASSWISGAKMLLRNGTTLVADIESVPELIPYVWDSTPLRIFSFLEMTGVRSRRPPSDILSDALDLKQSVEESPTKRIFLSPHALYSTTPELMKLVGQYISSSRERITTHVSESIMEFEMYMYKRGTLFDWLKSQREMGDCGIGSPVQEMNRNGLLREEMLAVHCNYLWQGDAELLAQTGTSVVHCPASHQFFRHKAFPRNELLRAGVNVCLGTDSLASSLVNRNGKTELSLFREMQILASNDSTISPAEMLRMCTINGAKALGQQGRLGEIRHNSQADIIGIPFRDSGVGVYEAIVTHEGPVCFSMISGKDYSSMLTA
ncbi:MAG: Amidohydrolase [Verrucomicrobiales bacterium]|nr:Amidohydrolase [Verrucomicrobiales bacterium]